MICHYRVEKILNTKLYRAQLIGYPNVVSPDSFGTKTHAEAYVASTCCLTLKEFREAKKNGQITYPGK